MLKDVCQRSFVLAEADWTAGEALRRLQPLSSDALLVVVSDGPPEAYYVFTHAEAIAALDLAPPKRLLHKALKLSARPPAPVLDGYRAEYAAPRPAIVMDGDRVLGVLPPPEGIKGTPGPLPPSPSALETAGDDETELVTRSVKTRFPRQVALEQVALLRLWFSAQVGAGAPLIHVAAGSAVTATVKPRVGFEVVGTDRGAITVTAAPESEALEFQLKAVDPGLGVIRVYLEMGGASLGYFDLVAQVVEGAVVAGDTEMDAPLPAVAGADLLPDLTLRIVEQRIEGKPHYKFVLSYAEADGGPAEVEFGPQPIDIKDAQDYFHKFFENVVKTPLAKVREELEWSGKDLFHTLFPEALRKAIWENRARGGISVQVVSEEPWVPWELCYLTGVEGGKIKEGPFLCEAFAITRWIRDAVAKPVLHLDEIALVVPAGSKLPSAPAEKAYLLSLAVAGRQVKEIAPTREGVLAAMEQDQIGYGAWHFTCHGSINPGEPNKSPLDLDGSALQPRHVNGVAANMGRAQPLVFLNACQTGAGGLTLTGAGGWANVFLRAAQEIDPQNGAAAFIGTYWKVNDKAALTFATAFYDALLKDKETVGEATRKARLKTKADHPNDSSWLAYTVYAHPLARVAG